MVLEDHELEFRIFEKGDLLLEKEQPLNKEGSTQTFQDEGEEPEFPMVFHFRVEEVKMFLRVVHFVTSQIIWEDRPLGNLGALEYLLGLQYLEWYEGLAVTSSLVNKENHFVYTLWKFLLSKEGLYLQSQEYFSTKFLELRKEINEHPESLGHLTFRNFRSELARNTFLSYIKNNIISRREIQRKHLYHPSHFKRSSDHSSSNSRSKSRGENPIPRTREFQTNEILELLDLSTHERKLHPLLGGKVIEVQENSE